MRPLRSATRTAASSFESALSDAVATCRSSTTAGAASHHDLGREPAVLRREFVEQRGMQQARSHTRLWVSTRNKMSNAAVRAGESPWNYRGCHPEAASGRGISPARIPRAFRYSVDLLAAESLGRPADDIREKIRCRHLLLRFGCSSSTSSALAPPQTYESSRIAALKLAGFQRCSPCTNRASVICILSHGT